MRAEQRPKQAAQPDPCCSFCQKSYREVGPFAEGPNRVYVCYPCIRLCASIIEQECERRGIPLIEEHR